MYSGCCEMSRIDKNTFLRAGILLAWSVGVALGFLTSHFYGDGLGGVLCLAPACAPSAFGLLAVNGSFYLISALAVFFHRWALFPISLLRGFSLGLMLMAVSIGFGGAGVMMSMLLLFSLLAFAPVLLWYWQRAFMPDCDLRRATLVCGIGWLAVWAADLWIVSPLLREIVIL